MAVLICRRVSLESQVAEPTNYVWQVADGRTGNWEDAANWMPTNVPGPADTVTIASGTCVASNYAACAALNLSGKGVDESFTAALAQANQLIGAMK